MKTIKAIVRLTERDARRVDLINFQAARIEELERQVAQQKIELEWYENEACKKDDSLVSLLEEVEKLNLKNEIITNHRDSARVCRAIQEELIEDKDRLIRDMLEANERMAAELDSIRLAEIREGTAVPLPEPPGNG